ncbi:hypothetical protein VOA_002646 [Vibrio sp. RC586]|nr:hypothetical protein VOA_002646 [Vibrio sp. RC586]
MLVLILLVSFSVYQALMLFLPFPSFETPSALCLLSTTPTKLKR